MPRALWSGAISFGLVNVPVRMYGAIEAHDLHFHYVHTKDSSRIGYEKICKKEGKPVPDKEIAKAFEYEKGEYVFMSDEDFEAAQTEGYKSIEIRDFVPYDEIDPIFFDKTYYLGPDEGAENVYALLRAAMEKSGLAAIAKYVFHDRQYLGCLRVREGVITLVRMHFADEIRPVDEIAPSGAKVGKREREMAAKLVDSFAGDFEPEKYRDTYRDTLCEIIQAKRKGKEIHVAEPEEPEETPDILSALRASLEETKGGRGRSRSRRNGGRSRKGDGLAELSRDELYERAKRADVPGRSEMTKEQLIDALQG